MNAQRKREHRSFEMERDNLTPKQIQPGVWRVPSQTFARTGKGKESHIVFASIARELETLSDLDLSIDFKCDCEDFKIHRADCKHILLVRAEYKRDSLRAFELCKILPLQARILKGMTYSINGRTVRLRYAELLPAWTLALRELNRKKAA